MQESNSTAQPRVCYIPAEIPKEPFSATRREMVFAPVSFLLGWCYANICLRAYYEA